MLVHAYGGSSSFPKSKGTRVCDYTACVKICVCQAGQPVLTSLFEDTGYFLGLGSARSFGLCVSVSVSAHLRGCLSSGLFLT